MALEDPELLIAAKCGVVRSWRGSSKWAQAAKFLVLIRDMPQSNLVWNTDYSV